VFYLADFYSDVPSGYDDPRHENRGGGGLFRSLGEIVLTLGAFHAFSKASNVLLRRGSRAAARITEKHLASRSRTLHKAVEAAKTQYHDPIHGRLGQFLAGRGVVRTGGQYATMGGVLRRIAHVEKYTKSIANRFRIPQYQDAYGQYQKFVQATTLTAGSGYKERAAIRFRHLQSFWGLHPRANKTLQSSVFQRMVGRRIHDIQHNYAPTLLGFYIAEKTLNFLPMGGHEAKGPTLLNPISVASDFTKFAVGWYPMHAAFGGALATAGLLRSGAQYAVAAGAEKIGTHRVVKAIDKADRFAENVINKAKRIRVTTSRSKKYAKDEIPPPWRRPQAWKGGQLYRNVRQGLPSELRGKMPTDGIDLRTTPFYKDVIRGAEDLATVARGHGFRENQEYSKFVRRVFVQEIIKPHLVKSKGRSNFLTDVLGMKQAKVGTSAANKAFDVLLSSRSMHPSAHQRKVIDMLSDSYLGRDIYESPSGRLIDLRKYKAGNVLKKVLSNIGKIKFSVPWPGSYFMPRPFQIGEIFRFAPLTQDRISSLVFGSKVDRDFGFNLGKPIQGAHPDAPTFFKPDKDSIGLFLQGRFYNIEKSGRATQLIGEHGDAFSRFHLMNVGPGSVLSKIQAARYGYLQSGYADIEKLMKSEQEMGAAWPKWKAWVHQNILRPAEVFDKGESVLYKFYSGIRRLAGAPTEHDRLSSELIRAMKSNAGASIGETIGAIRSLQTLRNSLGDAQLMTFNTLMSRDARNMLFAHDLHIPGGKSYTNIAELIEDKDKVVEIARALRGSPLNPKSAPGKVDTILAQIDGQGLRILGDRSSLYGKYELNKLQELQKFIVEESLLRSTVASDEKSIIENIGDHLLQKGTISKSEKQMLRAWDHMTNINQSLGHVENIMGMVDLGKKSNISARISLVNQPGGAKLIEALEYVKRSKRNIIAATSSIKKHGLPFEGYSGLEYIANARPGHTNPYMAVQEIAGSPFLSSAAEAFAPYSVLERFARIGTFMGVGLSPAGYKSAQSFFWKGIMAKRVALGSALFASWQGIDAFTDENPIFDGTMLDEGVNVAIAEQFVKHRLRMARVRDIAGITTVSKWAEGLMPGFTSIIPGGIAGGIIGAATGRVNTITTLAAAGALFDRALTDIGVLPDLSKSRDEMIDVYSGREDVPVRRGRWWEVGRTPYEGGRIAYWRPHWFPRMKAQAMFTPNMRGSKWENMLYGEVPLLGFNPVGTILDPYHYERRHYLSRPYPETGILGHEAAFIGPTFGATIGRMLKPRKIMHKAELEAVYNRADHWVSDVPGVNPFYGPGDWNSGKKTENYSFNTWGVHEPNSILTMNPSPQSKFGIRWGIGEQLYRSTELAGLYGFATESIMGGQPFESDPILANAGEMTSNRRSYWNLNLGGMMGSSEYLRRFLPRIRTTMDHFNPLKNKMPHWLPGGANNKYFKDFQYGDPYTKIEEGEIRLPGSAYEALHHVRFSFPASASWMGKPVESIASQMLGLDAPMTEDDLEVTEAGTQLHRIIQEQLARANMLVAAEKKVWDPYTNISGSVDAIIRKDRQNLIVEIKTISSEALSKLTQPKYPHYSQINTYMKLTGMHRGMVLYVSRDDPSVTRAFDVFYSQARYERDLANLLKSRQVAKAMQNEGYGRYAFEGYSMLDRLRVLADVAPYSDEYKETLKRVMIQQKLGMLAPDQIEERKTIVKHRKAMMHRYQLYPYRFKGRVLSPDNKYTNYTLNENIKAASEYNLPERVVGALWEGFTHLNTPYHTKFIQHRSPIEQYERTRLYGREAAFWNQPMRDFINPYVTAAISTNSPFEGAMRGALVGNVFLGGGAGATALSSLMFGVYGAAHGAYEALSDEIYIPKDVEMKREINTYFDHLKYLKAKRLYDATGNTDYAQQMGETMVGLDPYGVNRKAWTSMYRSIPYDERPFFDAFLRTSKKSDRGRISQIVSPELKDLLRVRWAMKEGGDAEDLNWNRWATDESMSRYFSGHNLPGESWLGWHPDVKLEDIKMKTISREGLDAHDFGLGWYEQERRIERSPWTPGPINIGNPTGEEVYPDMDVDTFALKQAIRQAVNQYGATDVSISVQVVPGPTGSSVLNLQVKKPIKKSIAGFVSSQFIGA